MRLAVACGADVAVFPHAAPDIRLRAAATVPRAAHNRAQQREQVGQALRARQAARQAAAAQARLRLRRAGLLLLKAWL
jgi:hypothetical protein